MKTRKTRIKFKRKRKVFAKLNRMATHNHSTTEPNPYIGNPAPPPSPSPSPQDSQLYQRPNSYLPPSADGTSPPAHPHPLCKPMRINAPIDTGQCFDRSRTIEPPTNHSSWMTYTHSPPNTHTHTYEPPTS